MADISNIVVLRTLLLEWFKSNKRKFHWRKKSISNYQKIVAEVLLQRTKAETIENYFPIFLKKFNSWNDIAISSIEVMEETLKPIGLYKQRANRLKNMACEIKKHNNRLPKNYDDLLKVPMIGQYIANAIMSVLYDKPYPMLDVNMARVIERYFGEREKVDIRYDKYLQEIAHSLVNIIDSKTVNWAVLDFAAKVCKARNPICATCMMSNQCLYFNQQTI